MARRFTSSRPAKKIHTLRWAGIAGASLGQAAGSVAINILAAGAPAETVLRIRGELMAWLDGAQEPSKEVLVSAGMILVPEGQGSTVIWDPFNDVNAPWIWYSEFSLTYDEQVLNVIASSVQAAKRVEIDNKAMRKGGPDEELQFVVTNTTFGGSGSVNLSLAGRILLGH